MNNNFKKDFLKLINNSTFDKTMENLRKRVNVKLVDNAGHYMKYVNKLSFGLPNILNRSFVAIHEIILLVNTW